MNIRNFAIIAHIDHGKSTLADRLLELTKTIPQEKLQPQFLDLLSLEREKGVTIKMQPCRMHYFFQGKNYILNLIDTPGHIDFQYEVSRALAAVEGVILLVDGTQGVQAQTIAHLELAKNLNLKIIPVINKIDLNPPLIENLKITLAELTNQKPEDVLLISAKTGQGVEKLIEAIILNIPPPSFDDKPKALVFDSHFDPHKGIIAHIRIKGGKFSKGDFALLIKSQKKFKIFEVGIFNPFLQEKNELLVGEIGYLATGIKEPGVLKIGETITLADNPAPPLSGYQEPKPMVFASVFPLNQKDFSNLKLVLEKIKLNDPSITFKETTSSAFGRGFLLGFLGLFHLEIIKERIKQEYKLETIFALPSVSFQVILKDQTKIEIHEPKELPDWSKIQQILEPWLEVEIFIPFNYFSPVMELMKKKRAIYQEQITFGDFLKLKYQMPLEELISGLFDQLKNITSGYGSLKWKFAGFKKGDLVKLDILIAEEINPALSKIVPKSKAEKIARETLKILKENLPRENFPIKLQAMINNRIIARETIPALKKDVAGWLYGGDRTRKMKLWQKQKRGKKKLQQLGKGKVQVPIQTLIKLMKI